MRRTKAVAVVAILPLVLVVGLIVLRLRTILPSYGADYTRDLGDVAPDSELSTRFLLKNETSSYVVLDGFDKACGVKAHLDGNPVLPPHSTEHLILSTHTSNSAGAGGASFVLGRNSAGSRKTETFFVKWNTIVPPWCDRSELWLPRHSASTEVVNVVGVAPQTRAEVLSAPAGVQAVYGNEQLRVLWTPTPQVTGLASNYYGDITLRVDGTANGSLIKVPVHLKPAASAALYPDSVVLYPHEKASLNIVGDVDAVAQLVCDDPLVKVEAEGGRVTLKTTGTAKSGWTKVKAVDRGGGFISSAKVFVVDRS